MQNCIICGEKGERHHIVFKSQGGIDIQVNYVYLCSEHHRGIMGPHKNREFDLELKLCMQQQLECILTKEYYTMKELIKLIGINPYHAKLISKQMHRYKFGYKRKNIIKRLMGNRLYRK
jgi:hypothetical protein